MSFQTIIIVGLILSIVAIVINVIAYVLERIYKKKMNKMANKE